MMYKIWFGNQYLGEAELEPEFHIEFDLAKLWELFENAKPPAEPAPRPLLFAARLIYRFSND
jgi:hypothetical protein